MSAGVKTKVKNSSKFHGIILTVFLMFLVFDPTSNNARQLADDGSTGGAGTHTFFANYGTTTRSVYCQLVTIGTDGGITISYYFATVYYLNEVCVYGGNINECTFGTQRLTYQGGGCSF